VCTHPDCTSLATEDDHVIGWAERGTMTFAEWDDRSNHQGLCTDHHRDKTRAEAQRGRTASG